jgi:hypothetical protein
VDLSNEEWGAINATLPNVYPLCDRIRQWDRMEHISSTDLNLLSRVRLSQVCFRDAGTFLNNAEYALGQAIAVRKYFMDRSSKQQDNNHVLADLRSRFYADYVPLLLYSAAEHGRRGIVEIFELAPQLSTTSGKYPLKKTVTVMTTSYSNSFITKALIDFDNSQARRDSWKYRDAWVHNKPPRVESILYDPPRKDFVAKKGNSDLPWGGAVIGGQVSPDYTWEQLVKLLGDALTDTMKFIENCADEWERLYSQL